MTHDDLIALKQLPASVPCGNCGACCRQDVIELRPDRGDEVSTYRHHVEGGRPVLDRKPTGECVYLNESRCTIHDKRPDICRRFDCRVLFLITPKEDRRIRIRQNPTMRAVYLAGKIRADTLIDRATVDQP